MQIGLLVEHYINQLSKNGDRRQATYTNRSATSADFVAATQNVDYGDMEKFKQMATDVEKCTSIAVSGGNVDDEKVSLISAMCITELYPSK